MGRHSREEAHKFELSKLASIKIARYENTNICSTQETGQANIYWNILMANNT